jgi:type-F conjugative transfer system pilin assembly protein TrbC
MLYLVLRVLPLPLFLLAGIAVAEDVRVPEDISKKFDQAVQAAPASSEALDFEGNFKKAQELMNSAETREMVNRSFQDAQNTMSGIDIQVNPGGGMDVQQMIDQASQARKEGKYPSPVFVFVSSSLPDVTMKALVSQSQAAGVPLVFRGLIKNDIKQTAKYIHAIVGSDQSNAGILIDPTLFERFSIDKVPAFTVAEGLNECGAQTTYCPVDRYATVFGDVTLDYALEKLQHLAPQFKSLLNGPLMKMRGGK